MNNPAKQTVLLTGATGLLGTALLKYMPATYQVTGLYHPADQPAALPRPSRQQLLSADLTMPSDIASLFHSLRPAVIIHTAAQSSLDWCELNQSAAWQINTVAACQLADLAQSIGSRFVFISSNAVFDGSKSYWRESDPPAPVNFYGSTKHAVEQYLAQKETPHLVLRPNLLFGWPPPGGRDNQFSRSLTALTKQQTISVVSDTWFSPLSADTCARAVWQAVAKSATGTYHLGGPQRLTLYEFSLQLAQRYRLDASLISPNSHRQTNAPAPRAIDTSFDISRLVKEIGFQPPSLASEFDHLQTQLPAQL